MCIDDCSAQGNDKAVNVECAICRNHFHLACIRRTEFELAQIDAFHCNHCEKDSGPSMEKPWRNYNRFEYWDAAGSYKVMQNGTPAFLKWFGGLSFDKPQWDDYYTGVDGPNITVKFFEVTGFRRPIVAESDRLGLKTSPSSVQDVAKIAGLSTVVPMIDVYSQLTYQMTLGDFLRLKQSGKRILNIISWEISDSPLDDYVDVPPVVAQLSWTERYWPRSKSTGHHVAGKPGINKFCLISMAGAYTDFHVDFSGTSVWYRVETGSKRFILIPPTKTNLAVYERWQKSRDPIEQFLLALMPKNQAFEITLVAGQTLLMPGGWIHAVLTPEDSLVYGGNFLHHINIPMQLAIHQMEKRLGVPSSLCMPSFEIACFLGICAVLDYLEACGSETGDIFLPRLLDEALVLHGFLQTWADSSKNRTNRLAVSPDRFKHFTYDAVLELLLQAIMKKKLLQEQHSPADGCSNSQAVSTANTTQKVAVSGAVGITRSRRKRLNTTD